MKKQGVGGSAFFVWEWGAGFAGWCGVGVAVPTKEIERFAKAKLSSNDHHNL